MSALERTDAALAELAELSLDILPEMYLPESGLFSHKTLSADGEYSNWEANVLYSAVSLVGILAQGRRPADSFPRLGAAMDGTCAAALERNKPGELANMVWACAMADDRRGEELLSRLERVDPRGCPSGELGQVLYGLVAGADHFAAHRDRAAIAARAAADELLRRFSPRAQVFRASPRLRRLPRRELVESGLTSFAAQVYPLHGLAALSLWTGEEPPEAVKRVAARIVDAQGPLGQWWWIYSSRTLTVLEGYPVYSVHQDGMAFLGLMELERLGLGSFIEPLALGLDWLGGANELGVSLVDGQPPLVNRCIQRSGSDADGAFGVSRYNLGQIFRRSTFPWLVKDRTAADPANLEVLRECRSYHLGWLLYADSLVEAAARRQAAAGG